MSTETKIAPVTKQLQTLCDSKSVSARIQQILGKRAPQFVSTLIQLSQSNNMLAACDPKEILSAAMTAATLDLPINPNLGYAYVVPYKDGRGIPHAQFQMGYKGFIQLGQRSGQIVSMNDFIVPHGALVSFNHISGELVVDMEKADESKAPDGYGFYFELSNGFKKMSFWTREKVEAHALRFSQAHKSGRQTPWKSDFDSMALKTVIKHALSKYAPLSIQMQTAVENDQAVIDLETGSAAYIDNADETQQALPNAGEPVSVFEQAEGVKAQAERQKVASASKTTKPATAELDV